MAMRRCTALLALVSAGCTPLRDASDLFGVWVVEDEGGAPVAARLLRAGDGGSATALEEYVVDDTGANLLRTGQYGLQPQGGRIGEHRYVARVLLSLDPGNFDGLGAGIDPFGNGVLPSNEFILSFDGERYETVTAWSDEVITHHRYASLP